jgi:shikimate kinase
MKSRGTTVWINCSVECLHSRLVKEKDKRPLIRSLPDDELKTFIVRKYSDRKIFYQQASVILSEEEVTLDGLVTKIFDA